MQYTITNVNYIIGYRDKPWRLTFEGSNGFYNYATKSQAVTCAKYLIDQATNFRLATGVEVSL